jgi:hypothetical protein
VLLSLATTERPPSLAELEAAAAAAPGKARSSGIGAGCGVNGGAPAPPPILVHPLPPGAADEAHAGGPAAADAWGARDGGSTGAGGPLRSHDPFPLPPSPSSASIVRRKAPHTGSAGAAGARSPPGSPAAPHRAGGGAAHANGC